MDCSECTDLSEFRDFESYDGRSFSSEIITDNECKFEMYTPRDRECEEDNRLETDSIRTEDFEKCFKNIIESDCRPVNDSNKKESLSEKYTKPILPDRSKLAVRRQAKRENSISSKISTLSADTMNSNDMSVLHGDLSNYKKILRKTQIELKQCRNLLEKVKAEQLLAEFKRDATLKEYEALNKQILEGRREIEDTKLENIKINNATEEAVDKERKVWMTKFSALEQSLSDQLNSVIDEKENFKRQLTELSNDTLDEKRKWKNFNDDLKQQLSRYEKKYDESNKDLNSIQKKYYNLQLKYRKLEESNLDFISKKSIQSSDFKENLQSQIADIKMMAEAEANQVRRQLSELMDDQSKIKSELSEKVLENEQLKAKLRELEKDANANDRKLAALAEDAQKALNESLSESQRIMKAERNLLEEERQKSFTALNDQYQQTQEANKQTVKLLQSQIEAKIEQNQMLKGKLDEANDLVIELQNGLELKEEECRLNMINEFKQWKAEKKRNHEIEINNLRSELNVLLNTTKDELLRERAITERQSDEIERLHQELDKLQSLLDDSIYSKQSALAELRHELTVKKHREVNQIKNCAENQTLLDCDKQQRLLQNVEIQLSNLRRERNDSLLREREAIGKLDRLEKQITAQMNDECRKIIETFAIQIPINENGSQSQGRKISFGSSLSYLRSIMVELKRAFNSIKADLKSVKQLVVQYERKRNGEIDKIRESFHKDKVKVQFPKKNL